MKRTILSALMTILVPACVFAVDGVVLINQSTVVAAGWFPYHITQPGSYKLSGSLEPPRNVVAMSIDADNVSLDLNGFTVSCPILLNGLGAVPAYCILSTGANTSIHNGKVVIKEDGALGSSSTNQYGGLIALGSRHRLEDLIVDASETVSPFVSGIVSQGKGSIVRGNTVTVAHPDNSISQALIVHTCPSLVQDNYASSRLILQGFGLCFSSNNFSDTGPF